MMISKAGIPQAVKGQGTVKKAKYARFFWAIIRGIALIVAMYAFMGLLAGFLFGGKWAAVPIFVLATYALIWMNRKPETLSAIEGEGTEMERQHQLPDWSLLAYGVIFGLGCNWVCVFLWFSRRYAFFSCPVVGVTVLIMAVYIAIALLVARLTRGNWGTVLLVFALAPGTLGSIVLRLRLF
jgi:hypothetical protein